MSEQDAFLRAICASPEDDTVRLVYADWLEEHGDAVRAEFIRLQCRLDSEDPFAPGRRALLRREWQLLRQHGERWIREDGLADMVFKPGSLWHYPAKTRFRRGFIDRGWFLSPDDFLRAAPDLFARTPITGIALHEPYTITPEQQQWFHNTYLVVVNAARGLPPWHLHEPRGTEFPEPDEFRRFVASPWFARLRSFAMNAIYSDRRHLEILAASPATGHLRELDLSSNICLFGEAWVVLTESPVLDGLQSLLLDKCEFGMDGLRALVNSPHLANLQRLSLGEGDRCYLGAEGIALICGSRALPQLRELNVCGQAGGAAGLQTLAAWPGLARLTRLDISHFGVWENTLAETMAAWTAFARSPNWGSLCELNLEGGESVELEAFLDSPNLATLRVLTFEFPFHRYGDPEEEFIQDEAAALLARCPHFADELELQIPSEGLSKKGRRLLRDRFGERLILYPADGGAHRQPGDWASGRPSRSTFHSEERHPEKPPRS
jgi:uncharacterized protein (TIGR02996 family)